jgi:hypothetical protein
MMFGRFAQTGVPMRSAALAEIASKVRRVLLENVMIQ